MVRCGCFWGTLDEFEKRVKEVHAGTHHEVEYMKEIAKVRKLLEDD
jgi:peptide methionine sulfoxide reductase MsrA